MVILHGLVSPERGWSSPLWMSGFWWNWMTTSHKKPWFWHVGTGAFFKHGWLTYLHLLTIFQPGISQTYWITLVYFSYGIAIYNPLFDLYIPTHTRKNQRISHDFRWISDEIPYNHLFSHGWMGMGCYRIGGLRPAPPGAIYQHLRPLWSQHAGDKGMGWRRIHHGIYGIYWDGRWMLMDLWFF